MGVKGFTHQQFSIVTIFVNSQRARKLYLKNSTIAYNAKNYLNSLNLIKSCVLFTCTCHGHHILSIHNYWYCLKEDKNGFEFHQIVDSFTKVTLLQNIECIHVQKLTLFCGNKKVLMKYIDE